MSTTLVPIPEEPADRNAHRHQWLAYTWNMAKKAGLVNQMVFIQGTAAASQMIRDNTGSGLTPDQYTMGQPIVVGLSQPYVDSAAEIMTQGLDKTVGPQLDTIEAVQFGTRTAIDAANADHGTVQFKETGATYGPEEAIAQVADDQNTIDGDHAAGLKHHERAPAWLRVVGAVAPYAEIIGLLTLLTFLFNVDILHPGTNLLAWVLTAVLVLVCAVTVAFAAHTGGVAHNQAREATGEQNEHAAEPLRVKRNLMIGLCAFLGAIVSATLIIRGLESLDQPSWYEVATIIALCVVAGFALPGLAYACHALDGSLLSRRVDALSAWLSKIKEEQTQNIEAAQGLIGQAVATDTTVSYDALPKVVDDTVSEVYAAVKPYEWAFVQVGASNIELPARPSVIEVDEDGHQDLVQSVSCGLTGAPALDIQPIKTSQTRLEVLRDQRSALISDLGDIKPIEFPLAA